MTFSLTDTIVVPFCTFLMEAKDIDPCKFIGQHWTYREAFRMAYRGLDDTDKLEALPKEKKLKLWEESLINCPNDRLNYCKAVHFYSLVTN